MIKICPSAKLEIMYPKRMTLNLILKDKGELHSSRNCIWKNMLKNGKKPFIFYMRFYEIFISAFFFAFRWDHVDILIINIERFLNDFFSFKTKRMHYQFLNYKTIL